MFVKSVVHRLFFPERSVYSTSELVVDVEGCTREDFEVLGERGSLFSSIFLPFQRQPNTPCVLFCHSSYGCRKDSLSVAITLLPLGIAVACFDFSGCGQSEGRGISFSSKERTDVQSILTYIRNIYGFNRFVLWGYEMGANSALHYTAGDPRIQGLVLDSPFLTINSILQSHLKKWIKYKAFSSLALHMAGYSITKTLHGLGYFEISIMNSVRQCNVPALFFRAINDPVIPESHVLSLFSEYGGSNKVLLSTQCSDESIRPPVYYSQVAHFIFHTFNNDDIASALHSSRLLQLATNQPVQRDTSSFHQRNHFILANSNEEVQSSTLSYDLGEFNGHSIDKYSVDDLYFHSSGGGESVSQLNPLI